MSSSAGSRSRFRRRTKQASLERASPRTSSAAETHKRPRGPSQPRAWSSQFGASASPPASRPTAASKVPFRTQLLKSSWSSQNELVENSSAGEVTVAGRDRYSRGTSSPASSHPVSAAQLRDRRDPLD